MKNHQELLEILARCAAACEFCLDSCLDEDDVKKMKQCIRLDRDCAKICHITASFIASRSAHAGHIIKEYEEICRECAEECSKHENDHCKQCALACEECADACSRFQATGV